jgi:hypothetical protein
MCLNLNFVGKLKLSNDKLARHTSRNDISIDDFNSLIENRFRNKSRIGIGKRRRQRRSSPTIGHPIAVAMPTSGY